MRAGGATGEVNIDDKRMFGPIIGFFGRVIQRLAY